MLILIWLCFGFTTAVVASNKGRSTGAWFVYGVALGPFALVHALVTHRNTEAVEARETESGAQRKCPACAELVKRDAIICRFCRTELPPLASRAPSTHAGGSEAEPTPAEKRAGTFVLIGIACAMVAVAVLASALSNS